MLRASLNTVIYLSDVQPLIEAVSEAAISAEEPREGIDIARAMMNASHDIMENIIRRPNAEKPKEKITPTRGRLEAKKVKPITVYEGFHPEDCIVHIAENDGGPWVYSDIIHFTTVSYADDGEYVLYKCSRKTISDVLHDLSDEERGEIFGPISKADIPWHLFKRPIVYTETIATGIIITLTKNKHGETIGARRIHGRREG